MAGKDGQLHTTDVEADSLFHAADQAVYAWSRLWWYRPDAVIEVQSGGDSWCVTQARLREWRNARNDS
jgi:hypothetical protein